MHVAHTLCDDQLILHSDRQGWRCAGVSLLGHNRLSAALHTWTFFCVTKTTLSVPRTPIEVYPGASAALKVYSVDKQKACMRQAIDTPGHFTTHQSGRDGLQGRTPSVCDHSQRQTLYDCDFSEQTPRSIRQCLSCESNPVGPAVDLKRQASIKQQSSQHAKMTAKRICPCLFL